MAAIFAIFATLRQATFAIFAIEKFAFLANMNPMSDPQLTIREWMQAQLQSRGHGAKGALAKHLGVRPDAITRMANTAPSKETREIRAHELSEIERFFSMTAPGSLNDVAPASVRIRGKAGAGPDGTVLFAIGDDDFGEADAPVNATPSTEALEVEGHSMRDVAHDGSLIYYDERRTPDLDHMGNLCVCWLEDGRVLIKYPTMGSETGLFNLESTSARTLRDVPVRFMAHVTSIVPRIAAQKLIRRRPDLKFQDQVISR